MQIRRSGFTLMELLAVIIIIGILAGVAVPMMAGYTKRAIASEAVSALGLIKGAETLYHFQNNSYATSYNQLVSAGLLKLSDLDGTYFWQTCYEAGNGNNPLSLQNNRLYIVMATTIYKNNFAPKANMVNSWIANGYIAMDDKGNKYSNIPELGYPLLPNFGGGGGGS